MEVLKRLGVKNFEPLPFFTSGLAQTIAAAFWPTFPDKIPKQIHDVDLEDGDVLRVVENRPSNWTNGDRIVVLVHGLGGNHTSNYMVRIAEKLFSAGYLVVRVNLRGCGVGFGKAQHPYHSGRSEDIRFVMRMLAEKYVSPVSVVGFSLGANIVLKLAGEDSGTPTGRYDSVVAVSPPVDLNETSIHLRSKSNLLFDQFFVWKLRYDIRRIHQNYPELTPPKFPYKMNLTDIDEYYTAPRSGFAGARDYYAKASSNQFIPAIGVRGLILCAEDDPIVNSGSLQKVKLPSQLELVMTKTGGHVGFLSKARDPQWMDALILKWIKCLP